MAKVPLRSYDREIESIIEHGQGLDEAVAHCHHILKTFPKHLETYRLLGKAYLEGKRYNEAVDIFQRVLVSVPDDFVSHVGMSIIGDDQGKLDDAIWHMERAFETQPSNAAIQGELQRLFGRRDGVEPPKIRLTRGALAHMYVQGELYTQAISEIRAVLGNDPGRTDMRVLLARAYFKNNQKTEAAEICAELLKRLPYCFDANRIMLEVLPPAQQADTQVYRHRVNELDPYAAFAQDSVFRADAIAESAVTLEKLQYTGQAVSLGAAWGGSAIGLETDSTAIGATPSQPDWLKAVAPSSEPPAPPAAPPQEEIPDFLRQAGWGESTGAFDESVSPFEEAPAQAGSDAVQADLPDWVRAMAPDDVPAPDPAPLKAKNPPSADTPDWLRNLGGDQVVEEEPQATTASGDVPDWLRGLGDATPEPPKPAPVAPAPVELPQPKLTQSPSSAPVEENLGPDPAAYLGGLGKSEKEQDDAMSWLESLAAKHGAKAEELVTDPNSRTDIAPDWVDKAREIGEPPAMPAPAAKPAPAEENSVDDTGMWLRNLDASEADTFVAKKPDDEPLSSDWRSGLAGGNDFASMAPEEEKEETPIADAQQAPDWLSGLGSTPSAPEEKDDDVPEWLRGGSSSVQETQPEVEPAQEFSSPASSASDLPDWLAGLDNEDSEQKPASQDDLPAWLQNEPEPEATEPTQPADWRPVEEKPAANPPSLRDSDFDFEEPVQPPQRAAMPKPEKKPAPSAPRPRPVNAAAKLSEASLTNAQAELGRGNIGAALDIYGKLIRRGKTLEEIIRDLREALYRYPVEVPIWQALGDAYMRASRLQEALDAYTKAEELLR